jgi:Undecaprenyl-phosphate glucose phosphotransferase
VSEICYGTRDRSGSEGIGVSSWVRTDVELHPHREYKPVGGVGRLLRLPYHLVEPTVVLLDLIVVVGISLLSGVGYNFLFYGNASGYESHLAFGVLAFTNISAVLGVRGDYRVSSLVDFKRQAGDILIVWTGVFLLLLAAVFSLKAGGSFSRGAILSFFGLGLVSMISLRGLVARRLSYALATGDFAQRNVIVIGQRSRIAGSPAMSEIQRCGYSPIRTIELSNEDLSESRASHAIRTSIDEVINTARNESVVEILLLIDWEHGEGIKCIVEMLGVLPIPVHLLPDENVSRYVGRRTINVGATWAAEVQRAPLNKAEQLVKRSMDIVGAATVLLLLSPLMLLTSLLIKLDSRGPSLFFQTRNGFNGRTFKIVKFRSMHVLEDGQVIRQACREDPRVTRLGRWLRLTNIDELPQLFNVLYGSMSLVGPRPHAVAHNTEFEKKIANYAHRHHVKPGITGWAQVNGFRGETPTTDLMAKRIERDLWYINNWSVWLDIKILIRTLILGLQQTAY